MHLNEQYEKFVVTTSTIQSQYHRQFYSVDHEATDGTGGGVDAVKLNLNFSTEAYSIKILGASSGLLCVFVTYRKRRYGPLHKNEDILIWNPSTRDSKLIPDAHHPCHISGSALVGFAYDLSINDGKIVRLTNINFKIPSIPITSRVDIYSMKSNSWKTTQHGDAPFSLVGVHARGGGCSVNGSIYWLVDFDPRGLERENYAQMVAFNIKENNFRKLQLPHDFEPCYAMHLKLLGGTLVILRFSSADELVVWTMKDDEKEEWIKLRDINVSSLNFNVSGQFTRLVYLIRNGKILVLLHDQRSRPQPEKKFVLYI